MYTSRARNKTDTPRSKSPSVIRASEFAPGPKTATPVLYLGEETAATLHAACRGRRKRHPHAVARPIRRVCRHAFCTPDTRRRPRTTILAPPPPRLEPAQPDLPPRRDRLRVARIVIVAIV